MTELGFLEENEVDWELHRAAIPNKFGGKPAWLNPKTVPSKDDVTCPSCGEICTFLLQFDGECEVVESGIRSIFVFCCKNANCYKKGKYSPFILLRCNLEEGNEFGIDYGLSESAIKEMKDQEYYCTTCKACGLKASMKCSACKKVSYCCKEHQVLDWKQHKSVCKGLCNSSHNISLHSVTQFKEMRLANEAEPEYSDDDDDDDNEELSLEEIHEEIKKIQPTMQNLNDLNKLGTDVHDAAFDNFAKIISHEPDQVMRYERGGNPLLCSADPLPKVPDCKLCGCPRVFEFQLMPAMLRHMNNETIKGDGLDWGTVLFYTCRDNCLSENGAYVAEYSVLQMPDNTSINIDGWICRYQKK